MTSLSKAKYKTRVNINRSKSNHSKGFISKNIKNQINMTHCVVCNDSLNLIIDHIFPLVLGGDSNINNLQCLCRNCNNKKLRFELKILKSLTDLNLAEKCGYEIYYHITLQETKEFFDKYMNKFKYMIKENIMNEWGKLI